MTNALSGAEAFVRMLQLHEGRHVFGLCGDTRLPFYDALYRLDDGISHILVRDERSAAYMADGYARTIGRVGELETIVRLKLPVAMAVVSNAAFGWIKAGQKAGFGQRYCSVDFGCTDHAAAFGVKSWRVEDPAALRPILRQAIEIAEPTLVDVVCQPLHEAQAPVSEWVV